MKTATGDIWTYLGIADVIFVTTNLDVRKDGSAVMGAGIAKQAKERWPYIGEILGNFSRRGSTTPNRLLEENGTQIWSFPTKGGWRECTPEEILPKYRDKFTRMAPGWARFSDIDLVKASTEYVANKVLSDAKLLVLPLPGTGNGGLPPTEITAILSKILDDRFLVINRI